MSFLANPDKCEKRRKQAASGGRFFWILFFGQAKKSISSVGTRTHIKINRRGCDTLIFHIPVFWIPAGGASSYLLAALPSSLTVVPAGMTVSC